MNRIKKKWLQQFAEAEAEAAKKEMDENVASAPQCANPSKSNDPSTKKDLNNPENPGKKLSKKQKKRLIRWLTFFVIAGTAIGLILYFELRKTEENINSSDIIAVQVDSANKKKGVVWVDQNGTKKSYSFDCTSTNAWAYSLPTYGESINQFKVFLPRNNDVPLSFNISIQTDASGARTVWVNDQVKASGTPAAGSGVTNTAPTNPEPLSQGATNLLYNTSITAVPEPKPFNWFGLISMLLPLFLNHHYLNYV